MTEHQNTPFEQVYKKLTSMEYERKIDLSILNDLKLLQKTFAELEGYWKGSEEVPIKEAFVLFHSARSSRMILEKMGLLFLKAKERHQNPQIVHSASLVLPCINDLYNMIEPFKERKVTNAIIPLVRRRLRALRDIAQSTSMLPSLEDEIRGVRASELKKKFEIIANNVEATISEE
ncbi:MAG: hypothetical protein ACE5HW_07285 [Candidatus Methanofastidiosia archaeon]